MPKPKPLQFRSYDHPEAKKGLQRHSWWRFASLTGRRKIMEKNMMPLDMRRILALPVELRLIIYDAYIRTMVAVTRRIYVPWQNYSSFTTHMGFYRICFHGPGRWNMSWKVYCKEYENGIEYVDVEGDERTQEIYVT